MTVQIAIESFTPPCPEDNRLLTTNNLKVCINKVTDANSKLVTTCVLSVST